MACSFGMRSCARRCSIQRTSCVGTSEVRVAPVSSIMAARRSASKRPPSTTVAPANRCDIRITCAIGQSGRTFRKTASLAMPKPWMVFAATAMRLQCRSITALGAPVVPPLKFSVARSPPSPSGNGRSEDFASSVS